MKILSDSLQRQVEEKQRRLKDLQNKDRGFHEEIIINCTNNICLGECCNCHKKLPMNQFDRKADFVLNQKMKFK